MRRHCLTCSETRASLFANFALAPALRPACGPPFRLWPLELLFPLLLLLALGGCARQAEAQSEYRGKASADFASAAPAPEGMSGAGAAGSAGRAEYAPAFGGSSGGSATGSGGEPAPADGGEPRGIAPVWRPLRARLARDGVAGPEVDALLASFDPLPTQSPMGRKMRELYRGRFMPSPRKQASPYYKGVVSQANAAICRKFIDENRQAFGLAQSRYGVPPSIACALLFVETRLGKVLGDVPENALFTLASMSVCREPEDIDGWLDKMPGYEKHLDWMRQTMARRADWAYGETRALLRHMVANGLGPERVPGSIYGAVGLCQFMPSNIPVYGADGNGDGRIDLFAIPDAVASLSRYLAKHGWKRGISQARAAEVLMSYNHSRTYADTILALARLIDSAAAGRAR